MARHRFRLTRQTSMSLQLPARAKRIESVNAPSPYLCVGKPYDGFVALRQLVKEKTGHDFLAVCGDLLRSKDYQSSKKGVANRSWHKTGRAFDYNQDDKNYVLVPEQQNGRTFFRTYLRCSDGLGDVVLSAIPGTRIWQSGKLVAPPSGKFFDFTNAAFDFGFSRIPAWRSWHLGEGYSTEMEFWHYQCDEGMTWQEAMDYFYAETDKPQEAPQLVLPTSKVLGRNDRGAEVSKLQAQLSMLGFLTREEIDGVFGAKTHNAVSQFQLKFELKIDGLVGPATRQVLEREVKAASTVY